jgi:hypothetical protein
VIAGRATEHGSGMGIYRWVVEQSFALLHSCRWFGGARRAETSQVTRGQ